MNIGFVIGNGISRKGFDLRQLYGIGQLYGCNALHREIACQYLVCTSRKHLSDAMNWNCHKKSYVYTTNDMISLFKNPNLELLPKLPSTMSAQSDICTGTYALNLASSQNHSVIILFGFDFNQSNTDNINNIYADTDGYPLSNSPKVSTSKYITQANTVIRQNTNIQYVFINDTFKLPDLILNNKNVSSDTYDNMLTQLLT